jgi:AcrR family transcriptional regulator
MVGMTRSLERTDLRREEILDASERVFARKGYHATGIADIAEDLGIGHGTFYRYFKNKHDIAVHVFDRITARFATIGLADDPESTNTLEDYRAQVRRILSTWLALGNDEPHVLRFFHEHAATIDMNRMTFMVEQYVLFTMRFLRNGVDKKFLRADLDVRATAEMLVALMFEGTKRALLAPDADARQRWCEAGMALMFDGISRAGER